VKCSPATDPQPVPFPYAELAPRQHAPLPAKLRLNINLTLAEITAYAGSMQILPISKLKDKLNEFSMPSR
jgi:hypothetical protein